MKIKLQDYSLISNEWIEEKIKHLKWSLDHIPESYIPKHQAQIYVLSELQKELIPAEKLADVCFEAGEKRGYEIPALQMRAIPINEAENPNKQDYLNSEIDIQ